MKKLTIITQGDRMLIVKSSFDLKQLNEEDHGIDPKREFETKKASLEPDGILIEVKFRVITA